MIPILFLVIIMQFVLTIISYTSINLKVTNEDCKEEVRNVKHNKLAWRILQTLSFVLLVFVFV